MATIDSLPPDQRAVLQLVLQRGRSYGEIANLLSIDRSAVRQRALDALDALTPAGAGSAAAERSLITDYLLRQLPPVVADQVQALLATSSADNHWARAISRELTDFGGDPATVPELGALEPAAASSGTQVVDSARNDFPDAVDESAFDRQQFDEPPQPPIEHRSQHGRDDAAAPVPEGLRPSAATDHETGSEDELWLDDDEPASDIARSYERTPRERPAGSRKGGLVLLGGIAAVAVVVIVLLVVGVFSGGGNSAAPATADHGSGSTKSAAKTGASSNTAKYLAQINLKAPDGATTPAGIVQVIEETLKSKVEKGIVVYADNVPANTKHNAYAMWLSNPGGGSEFIGFVPKLVGKNGKLQTEGELPKNATDYKQILVTLETSKKPTKPGTVVLSGVFTETPTK